MTLTKTKIHRLMGKILSTLRMNTAKRAIKVYLWVGQVLLALAGGLVGFVLGGAFPAAVGILIGICVGRICERFFSHLPSSYDE